METANSSHHLSILRILFSPNKMGDFLAIKLTCPHCNKPVDLHMTTGDTKTTYILSDPTEDADHPKPKKLFPMDPEEYYPEYDLDYESPKVNKKVIVGGIAVIAGIVAYMFIKNKAKTQSYGCFGQTQEPFRIPQTKPTVPQTMMISRVSNGSGWKLCQSEPQEGSDRCVGFSTVPRLSINT